MWQLLAEFLLRLCGLGLLPMKAVRLRLGTLLAADATTLAPALAANKVALIKAAFTPAENLAIGDIVLADFDGSTPKSGSTGTQQSGLDPITNQQIVTITEPAGGWRWITTGVTNLPQAIFGYALIDDAEAVLLGVALLPAPIPLTVVGQEINLGTVKLSVVLQPLS